MCPHSPSCLSETALLYVAESVCAFALRNATKVTGDKAHATHLLYTHWINGVRATSKIMARHGISPKLNKEARKIIPDLALINDYFNATPANKVTAKRECHRVVTNLFGERSQFAATINGRVLRAIKYYGKDRSLLAMMKMWGAYHIKINKKRGQFLLGGTYYGTKQLQDDMRDSLFLKTGTSRTSVVKVVDFDEMSLATNDSFLAPQDLAAAIFHCVGKKAPKTLKRAYASWKKANDLPYVVSKDANASDGGEGTGGGGGGGTKPKKLTKQALMVPLEELSNALESLNEALVVKEDLDLATYRLQHLVTDKFTSIAGIVNHRVCPRYTDDDDDDYSVEDLFADSDSDDEGDDANGEEREHGSRTEESEDDDDNSESEDNDDHAGEDADASRVDGSENELEEATNEGMDVEIEENDTEGSSQLQTQPEQERLDENMNEPQQRKHIAQFVTTLQAGTGDISEYTLANKDIKDILALSKQPNISNKGHFYAFKSAQLNEIEAAYKAIISGPSEDPQGDGWVAKISHYIKEIKRDAWHNSFVDLPHEGKTLPDNVLLLWKIDDGFSATFYNEPSPTSPAKNAVRRSGRSNHSPSSVNGIK